MIISDLEHLEDVATETSLVGSTISGGLSCLLNLNEINNILAAYKLPSLTLGNDNKLYAALAASPNTYKVGDITYSLSAAGGSKYSVSSSSESKLAY